MSLGVVNHDNCVLHVAEIALLPGLNLIDEAHGERLLADPAFRRYLEQERVEIMRTRGKIRVSDPGDVGDKRNFAMEELGNVALDLRRKALYEQPDQLRVAYRLLQAQGLSPSAAREALANRFGLDIEDINARLNG